MKTKRVLIITYYWPPSGGSGVQRWLKFVKYLPQFGWTPIVYTPENPSFALRDSSLVKDIPPDTEILKSRIWEPHVVFHWLSRLSGNAETSSGEVPAAGRKSVLQKLGSWIRVNIFIPDSRVFWVNPSVRFLENYLETASVDVVVSTGPPHSMHLIARQIAKKFNLPWVADFRDPWTSLNSYYGSPLTARSNRRHDVLEREILAEADAITVVGSKIKEEFNSKRSRETVVLPNGYDPADFESEAPVVPDVSFTLLHAGSFVQNRNPAALWSALSQLKREGNPLFAELCIKLIGRIDPFVVDALRDSGLLEYCDIKPYQPHADIVTEMKAAQVLLLPIDNFDGARWVITGKLFEYLAARRPIFCIGPVDGEAAQVLRDTRTGVTFDFHDVAGIRQHLIELYSSYKKGFLHLQNAAPEQYSRLELTRRLAAELDKLI